MKRSRGWIALLIFVSSMSHIPLAVAQVPPHQPGTICFTKQFWCWANPPGAQGNPCACPSPYGWVQGQLN